MIIILILLVIVYDMVGKAVKPSEGNPFTIWVPPETRCPVIYFKEAASAIVELRQAPLRNIKTVNYLIGGTTPVASAGELADIVRARVPGAQIDFKPNPELIPMLRTLTLPIDDSNARQEWGWAPRYDQERIVDDFLQELKLHLSTLSLHFLLACYTDPKLAPSF